MLIATEFQHIMVSYAWLGELMGVAGAIVYISGFFLLQKGRICGNSNAYALSKVVAALLVLVSLITAFNLAAFIIQVAYAVIGLYGIFRRNEPFRKFDDLERNNHSDRAARTGLT